MFKILILFLITLSNICYADIKGDQINKAFAREIKAGKAVVLIVKDKKDLFIEGDFSVLPSAEFDEHLKIMAKKISEIENEFERLEILYFNEKVPESNFRSSIIARIFVEYGLDSSKVKAAYPFLKIKRKLKNDSLLLVFRNVKSKSMIHSIKKTEPKKKKEKPKEKKSKDKSANKNKRFNLKSNLAMFTQGFKNIQLDIGWTKNTSLSGYFAFVNTENEKKNVQKGMQLGLAYNIYFSDSVFSNGFYLSATFGYLNSSLIFTDNVGAKYEADLAGVYLGGLGGFQWYFGSFNLTTGAGFNYYSISSEISSNSSYSEKVPVSQLQLVFDLSIGYAF